MLATRQVLYVALHGCWGTADAIAPVPPVTPMLVLPKAAQCREGAVPLLDGRRR